MTKALAFRLLACAALASVAAAPALAPTAALAQASDPAAQQVEVLDAALIRTMKAGKDAGAEGRYKIMAPAVDAVFDLPAMIGFAVGPSWATTSAEDKAALTAAFRKFTIASYAKNFDSYGGQKIALAGDVQTRGLDKLVKTQMTGGGADVVLIYRMRQSAGTWKVIDVLFNGAISQLTTQRSDFSATLAAGGPKALVAKLDAQSAKLLK
jgi:phospholipid transport system substrate-binding protein